MLTQERLKELLDYDPDTGVFTRLRSTRKVGWTETNGYIRTDIDGTKYGLHILAWLYVTGTFPKNKIDHKNGVRSDNVFDNLRDVSNSDNAKNCKIPITNTSGILGVRWCKYRNRWISQIGSNNKTIGKRFDNQFDAICFRKSLENSLKFHPNHGRVSCTYAT